MNAPHHYSVKVSHNRPLAVFRSLVLRHRFTPTRNGWRWRIMCESDQLASGIERRHTLAKLAATAAAVRIRKERAK